MSSHVCLLVTRWQASYDALNRLLGKTTLDDRGDPQTSFAYTYDPKGNVLSETSSRHAEDRSPDHQLCISAKVTGRFGPK